VLLRRIARPLFASWFVVEGVDAVRHPSSHAAAARLGLESVRDRAAKHERLAGAGRALDRPLTDRQLALAVQGHGAATVAAAGLLAIGKAPRAAGLALAVLTVPLVVANAPAGKASSDDAEAARRRRFWSALSGLGGALLAAADTAGQPGVAYRVHAAREARAAAKAAAS
jgi:uncharacterized membrane protein YphA (DoxX/SURF4 family)